MLAAFGSLGVSPARADTVEPATIAVGQSPAGVAVSPDGVTAYVTNTLDNSVSVINTATGQVVNAIPVGYSPTGVTFSADGATAYVANGGVVQSGGGAGSISVIDTATQTVTRTLGIPYLASDVTLIAVSGTTAYFIGANMPVLYSLDLGTYAITSLATIPLSAVGLAVSGGRLYLAYTNGTVEARDLSNPGTVAGTVTLPSGSAAALTLSSDGSRAYVTNPAANTVSVVNTTSWTVATVPVGLDPRGIVLVGARAYVTAAGENAVTVFDLGSGAALASLPVGAAPLGVAANLAGSKVYVTNQNDQSVSVIDVGPVQDATPTFVTPAGALANASTLSAYSQSVHAVGTPTAITYAVTGGALPPGLSLDGSTGRITGTATTVGTYSFTVTATNAASGVPNSADRAFTITVTTPAPPAVVYRNSTAITDPRAIVFSPDGKQLYVADNNASLPGAAFRVVDMDPDSSTYTQVAGNFDAQVPSGQTLTTIAVSPDGRWVYGGGGNGVSILDTQTGTVTWLALPTGTLTREIAFTPDSSRAFVAEAAGGNLVEIRTADQTILRQSPMTAGYYGIAITPDGTRAYLTATSSGTVLEVDIHDPSVATYPTRTISLGGGSTSNRTIRITPDGTSAWLSEDSAINLVGTQRTGIIWSIDTDPGSASYRSVSSVNNPSGVTKGVALTPDGTTLYTAATTSFSLPSGFPGTWSGITFDVVNTWTNTVLETVPEHRNSIPSPGGVAANGNAVVLSYSTGSGSALDIYVVEQTPVFQTPSLPHAGEGVAYDESIVATGVPTQITYTIVGGSLPPGLTMGTDGVITGTPAAGSGGSYTFTVQARNGATVVPNTATRDYTIVVEQSPVIQTPSLPDGALGTGYDQTLTATGVPTAITYAVTGGSLPPGLSLNGATGRITGTPTTPGSYSFTVSAQNGATVVPNVGTHDYTIEIPVVTHTVTFDSAGGSTTPPPQTVADGGVATRPVAPTRSGFTFIDWYAPGATTPFDFATAITGDLTLTAHWSAVSVPAPVPGNAIWMLAVMGTLLMTLGIRKVRAESHRPRLRPCWPGRSP